MHPNPYEPPGTSIATVATGTIGASRDLLREWERRRIWFNAILVVLTLLMGVGLNVIFERRFWVLAGEGAVVVNVCYCTGPVATWYLSRLGFNSRMAGTGLYWAGTVLTVLLATISLLGRFFLLQD